MRLSLIHISVRKRTPCHRLPMPASGQSSARKVRTVFSSLYFPPRHRFGMIQSFISIYPSRLDIACLCIHYNLFIPEILSERIGHDIFHNLFTRRIGINTIADPRRIKRINIRRDIIRIADIPLSLIHIS